MDGYLGEVYGCCFLGDGDGGVVVMCLEMEVWVWDVERGTTTAKTASRDDLGMLGVCMFECWLLGYLFFMV